MTSSRSRLPLDLRFQVSPLLILGLAAVHLCTTALADTLTNGVDQPATLVLHATNSYTFYATNGDVVLLRAGAPTFRPRIDLYAPNGSFITAATGTGSGSVDAYLPYTATTNGTFSVGVSSYYGTGSGSFSLQLARVPAPFDVSPSDEGGALANGSANPGTIGLGDIDMWSFSANPGDGIVVRIGTTGFRPLLAVYDPNGAQVGSSSGNGSAAIDAYVLATAAASGIYTVVAQAYAINGTGPYTLHLAKAPGSFTVPAGDEGGLLTNGAATPGVINIGDLDMWSLDATNGDNLLLRIGSPDFRPWIRLYGPTGILVKEAAAGTSSDRDTALSVTATNTGTFAVVVQSYYFSLSSPYTLTLARIPGTYTVSPGDEGGTLINGAANHATNALGDIDLWTFTATTGDAVALRVGAPAYRPQLSMYGPGGVLIQTAAGSISSHRDASIFIQVTNTGTFTVVEQGFYTDNTGAYTLNFGHFPGGFIVSPGDEGGTLTNGISQDAAIDLGDFDLWGFSACQGYPIILTCQKLSGLFTPRIRLYGRNGALLATAQSATTAMLSYPGTNSGSFTAVIDGAGVNDSGTYRLTGSGIYEAALRLCPPVVSGGYLHLSGYGGTAGNDFTIVTATNAGTSLSLWTPILTNQFDSFGGFDSTNISNLGERKRFFGLREQ